MLSGNLLTKVASLSSVQLCKLLLAHLEYHTLDRRQITAALMLSETQSCKPSRTAKAPRPHVAKAAAQLGQVTIQYRRAGR